MENAGPDAFPGKKEEEHGEQKERAAVSSHPTNHLEVYDGNKLMGTTHPPPVQYDISHGSFRVLANFTAGGYFFYNTRHH